MAENWKPYLCNVNDKLASILVDLALRGEAPIASKPWLLWTWVYFQSPRTAGLSDSKEAPILYEIIEDTLHLHLSQACQAMPCGRITTDGRREFYFYAESNEGFPQAVRVARKEFKGYRFDIGDQEDPLWEHYLDVLYPSPEGLQRIANIELLDVLVKKGNVLTVAREVQHWIYFRPEPSRAFFREATTASGFKIVGDSECEGELSFGISVTRTQSIEQASIDRTVIELLNLAQRFNGEYDGWETPLVTQ